MRTNGLPATALALLLALGAFGLAFSACIAPAPAWASSGSGSDGSIDDAIDDEVDDEIADEVEEAVEQQVSDSVEEQVEDEVEDSVEDAVEDSVESDVEDRVEQSVEQDVEDEIESSVEDAVEGSVEDDIEGSVEDDVEDEVESDVEDDIENEVEDAVEDEVESDIEDDAEEDVEDDIESDVEDDLESDVEDDLESDIEDDVESGVEDDVEDQAGKKAEDTIEDRAEHEAEDRIDHELDDTLRDDAEHPEDDMDDRVRDVRDDSSGSSGADGRRGEARKADEPDAASARRADGAAPAERFTGLGVDDEGNDVSLGEWLVIASEQDIAALEKLGYVTRGVERLEGLDRVLARLEAPETFDIAAAQAAIRRAAPDAEVDYNHVYEAQAEPASQAAGKAPRELFPAAASDSPAPAAIGVVDTGVDLEHPALRGATVHTKEFAPAEHPHPAQHGTSVVSILVGDAPAYHGLLPGAEIYAASVFFIGPNGKQIATTASLVRALDWMTRNRVPVVNMSLAGPPNAILETAVGRAFDAGTVVVAAVGNRGPAAKPLYPAAYSRVIAVTAVGEGRKVYRLANRGAHVDFAAPGVDVLHAEAGSGYGASSGTSMASVFVAAVIATSCGAAHPVQACLQELESHALDLGAQGRDPVYGYGVIVPLRASHRS